MNTNLVKGLIGLGGCAFLGGCAYVGHKVDKMTKKVGMAAEEIGKASLDDIRESMIQQAIEKAADKETRKYAREAGADAMNEMKAAIKAEVKKAVEEAYQDLRQGVTDEISTQASNLDIDKLQKEIVEKAEKKVMARLDVNMNQLLEPMQNEIRRAAQLRSSLMEALNDFKKPGGLTISAT